MDQLQILVRGRLEQMLRNSAGVAESLSGGKCHELAALSDEELKQCDEILRFVTEFPAVTTEDILKRLLDYQGGADGRKVRSILL